VSKKTIAINKPISIKIKINAIRVLRRPDWARTNGINIKKKKTIKIAIFLNSRVGFSFIANTYLAIYFPTIGMAELHFGHLPSLTSKDTTDGPSLTMRTFPHSGHMVFSFRCPLMFPIYTNLIPASLAVWIEFSRTLISGSGS
jgi:hypothetical protein